MPGERLGGIYSTLNKKRGMVFHEEQRPGTPMYTVKAYLPVSESFGFTGELRAATGGQAFPQLVFDHWQTMNGKITDKGSKCEELAISIRTRKGLKPEIPTLDQCMFSSLLWLFRPGADFDAFTSQTSTSSKRCPECLVCFCSPSLLPAHLLQTQNVENLITLSSPPTVQTESVYLVFVDDRER